EEGGINLYGFALNNPLNNFDSDGQAVGPGQPSPKPPQKPQKNPEPWGYPLPPGWCGPPSPCPPNPDASKPGWRLCGSIPDRNTGFPCPAYCPPKDNSPRWTPPRPPPTQPPPRYKDCLTEPNLDACINCCYQYPNWALQEACQTRCKNKKWD